MLPRHRGASAINWAVINGEAKTGLSIFWPDEGLDTGPILLQKEVTIEPDDTIGTVYFNKLFTLGVEALLESVQLVKQGKAPRIVQDLSLGEYEPICKRMAIDWMYPVGVVYNVIRGCNPSPGAVTTLSGQELKVLDCERRAVSGPQAPGTIAGDRRRWLPGAGLRRQHLRQAGAAGRRRKGGGSRVRGERRAQGGGQAGLSGSGPSLIPADCDVTQ